MPTVAYDTGPIAYDIGGYTLSQPTDGQVLERLIAARDFTLTDAGVATSTVATTAEAIYLIKLDAVQIGTITYAAAATDGVVSLGGSVDVAEGQVLTVEAPATADATHDGLTWTLTGVSTSLKLV